MGTFLYCLGGEKRGTDGQIEEEREEWKEGREGKSKENIFAYESVA